MMNPAEVRRTFRDVRLTHVGSLLPDGAPHVVPLWFVWLEDAVYVFGRRDSRVWRNLERDPRVALQFDRGLAWTEHAGVVVTGEAELLPPEDPGAKRALSAWFEKYRGELAGFGFAAYMEQIGEPVMIRVRPDRLATWIHAYQPGS
jgi:nitroimidazol reductase NimA-like FMN-containing flavoprotein (pyridoxamine 5'-phosphate oxidase superfamily)